MPDISIHDAIEEYLGAKQNSVTRKTYQWYAEFLDLFEKYCTSNRLTWLVQVSPQVVQSFVSDCPANASPHTRHARAQIVKGWLRWCSLDDEMIYLRVMLMGIRFSQLLMFDPNEEFEFKTAG